MAATETRQADERGRLSLGTLFANCTFLVETVDDGILIRPARVIPEREAWLYENPEALSLVRKGLTEARDRKFARAPSLAAAERLADKMKD